MGADGTPHGSTNMVDETPEEVLPGIYDVRGPAKFPVTGGVGGLYTLEDAFFFVYRYPA
jgi:hypothetical protein